MSGFDKFSKHNFVPQEQLKQFIKKGKLEKVDANKQETHTEQQQVNIQENPTQNERIFDKVEASALEALANQNRGGLGIIGNLTAMDTTKPSDNANVQNAEFGGNTAVTPNNGDYDVNPTNADTYADREKYTQEAIDSLNIGIESGKFKSIINQYFNKVTINGEEVYILKSGTLTQVKDLISQIYVADKLSSTQDFIPRSANPANGYALIDQNTYEARKANYYYMCYVNGIPYDGHEFENGTYNKDIATACGLFEYENVFEWFMRDIYAIDYLQENFGITVSNPPSQEHMDLWNKLAKLAAIGENGENTGEYNKYNVIKYFGLALTDPQFMSFVDKASFKPEDNSVLNNSWDIETVKSVITERYPELLENSEVLTDEFLEWIGSNAFEFLLYNQSKLRAGNIQEFVNYGNIPSWITFNNGTEFNKELLLKCCIQSMAELANIGSKLGYDPKEFVNENLAEYVTEMYNSEIENIEETGTTGGPRRAQGNNDVPDYIINFFKQKYGGNITVRNGKELYFDNKILGYYSDYSKTVYIALDNTEVKDYFYTLNSYSFENNKAVPGYKLDSYKFLETYYSDEVLPPNERAYFKNGLDDLYECFLGMNFSTLCSVLDTIYSGAIHLGRSISLARDIQENENTYSFLCNHLEYMLKNMGENYNDLYDLLQKDNCNIFELYHWTEARKLRTERGFNNFNEINNALSYIYYGEIEQGSTGDCWFLSFLMAASAHDHLDESYGGSVIREIMNNCIDEDYENEIITVMVSGHIYKYSFAEVDKAAELSTGNRSLRALELAMRNYYADNPRWGRNPAADGGSLFDVIEFFSGGNLRYRSYSCFGLDNKAIDHINSGEYISVFSVKSGAGDYNAIDIATGKEVRLSTQHAYAVEGIDGKYIYLRDPHGKRLKLSLETIKNNPNDFGYEDIQAESFINTISVGNVLNKTSIQYILQNGCFLDENGKFDYRGFYNYCQELGVDYFSVVISTQQTIDNNGDLVRRLEIYDEKTGRATTIIFHKDGQTEIIALDRPTIFFEGNQSLWDTIFGSSDDQLSYYFPTEYYRKPDGSIDRERMANELENYVVDGIFDEEAFRVIRAYFTDSNGNFDQESYDAFIDNYHSVLPNVAGLCMQIKTVQMMKLALSIKNMREDPFLATEAMYNYIMNINNNPKRPNGSIYAGEMSYWDWADVMSNPYASTEDVIQAINAMNSIINAAKSIGVSLDAYMNMNPEERERRRGMLTTPMNYQFVIPKDNYIEVDENGNVTYFSVSNQSSCTNAPDWFIEYYMNGEMLPTEEIDMNILLETNSEAEEELYLARQHYQYWQDQNSSILAGFSPIEQYNIYQMDMMYFMMWLNTDAIVEGYSKDDMWEDLYAAYHESGFGMI